MSIAETTADFATMRSNVVTINVNSNAISSITYVSDSLVITPEPYQVPPSITSSGSVYKITLDAGRKGNADTASKFNSTCGGMSKEYAPPGDGDSTPRDLNFMFGVIVNFQTGGSAFLYLAQGHHDTTNNWWMGGSPVFAMDTPRLEYTFGNSIYMLAVSGDHETFNLVSADKRPVSQIQNVFVLMLENHSFDNMLAFSGIPNISGATTSDFNSYDSSTYNVVGNALGSMPTDPGHEFPDVLEQLAGQGAVYQPYAPYPTITNSGFVANYATTTTEGKPPTSGEVGDIMMCFDTASQLPVLHQLASEFVVCDHWFSSLPGPTWPNRFFLHGASSNGLDHSPTDFELWEWETAHGFEYPKGSIFDAMNANDILWRLYHDTNGPMEGTVSQVSALKGIKLTDVHSLSTFESDINTPLYPYQYTFIEPNYGDIINGSYEGGSSQHPMDGVTGGEALITTIYESIRNSPLWQSSLLIITYDEHGGFYDHFAPIGAVPPNDGGESSKYNQSKFTFAQYGVRVPAVIISPYIPSTVDTTVYDHSSVLATLEWLFGLPHLTDRDGSANVIKGVVSSSQLRTDTPAKLNLPASPPPRHVLTPEERSARELEPVPKSGNLVGFLGVLLKADSELAATPADRMAAIARFQTIKTRGDARVYLHEVMAKVQAEKAKRGTL